MAVDRAAAGLVAEERQAARLASRPGRLGSGAADEVVLRGAGRPVEQVAADVAARERAEVVRGRVDPARGADERHRAALGQVLDLGQGVVAVDGRLRHVRSPAGSAVRRSPSGWVTSRRNSLRYGTAGRRLGDQRDDDVVGVRVLVVGARRVVERLVADEVDQPQVRDVTVQMLAEVLLELRVGGVARQPAGVAQRLAEGHGAPVRGQRRDPGGDRVVEAEDAVVDERERDRAGERLRDRGDPHLLLAPERLARLDVGDPGVQEALALAAVEHRRGSRRAALDLDQMVERALQPLDPLVAVGGGRRGRQRQRRRRDHDRPARSPHHANPNRGRRSLPDSRSRSSRRSACASIP